MAIQHLLAVSLAAAVCLGGCASTSNTNATPALRPRIEPPPQDVSSLRLIIYRPQTLVGMLGKPVIVVNGQKMLTTLGESSLEPGSVFVVDAPAGHTLVQWIQSRKTEPSAETLVFNDPQLSTRYLRWTLKPTYGYLEAVTEADAVGEIVPLRYMGYKNLVTPRR